MKKALSIVLALIMCLSLLPTAALGDDDGLVIEGTTVIHNYCGSGEPIVIPEGVTRLGDNSMRHYYGDEDMVHDRILGPVTFPSTLREIGRLAFAGCNIPGFTFPSTVTKLGENAFYSVSFIGGDIDLVIPGGLTDVPDGAFFSCNGVRSITLSEGVKTVGDGAFFCNMSSSNISLPDSLISIGNQAFANFEPTSLTIPANVTHIGEKAFFTGYLETLTIKGMNTPLDTWMDPNTDCVIFGPAGSLAEKWAKEHSVTFRVNDASSSDWTQEFIASATIENFVIKEFDEENGNWTNLVIPEGIVGIDEYGLADLTTVKTLTLPDSLTYIGARGIRSAQRSSDASYTGSIERVNFGKGLKTIAGGVFDGQEHITELTIPDSVESIGHGAFRALTGLRSITLGKSLVTLGGEAFYDCASLEEVNFTGTGLKVLEEGTFGYCASLKNIVLPEGLETVKPRAFHDTALDSITIPASVTTLWNAFEEAENPKMIYGVPGSFAEEWAVNNGIPFSPIGSAPAEPVEPPVILDAPETGKAKFDDMKVSIDGVVKELPAATIQISGGGVTYVYIRDLAMLLTDTSAKFEVGYEGCVNLVKGEKYTVQGVEFAEEFTGEVNYTKPTAATKVNGVETELKGVQFNNAKGGYTYYQLRDLGYNLGFNVKWDNDTKTIAIETDKPYTGK